MDDEIGKLMVVNKNTVCEYCTSEWYLKILMKIKIINLGSTLFEVDQGLVSSCLM